MDVDFHNSWHTCYALSSYIWECLLVPRCLQLELRLNCAHVLQNKQKHCRSYDWVADNEWRCCKVTISCHPGQWFSSQECFTVIFRLGKAHLLFPRWKAWPMWSFPALFLHLLSLFVSAGYLTDWLSFCIIISSPWILHWTLFFVD